MATDNHTPIPSDGLQEATAALFNSRFSDLDTAIGDRDLLGTETRTSLVAAIGSAALRTTYKLKLIPAINEVLDRAVAAQAEIDGAAGGYDTLSDRLDALIVAGGNVATLTNGAANASQKTVTVDSTVGFVVGSYVAYQLAGGGLEYNTVATITPSTTLELATNIGTGGIPNNRYISMISPSEYLAAQTIPHAGALTLPQAMEYANGGVFHVEAHGAVGDFSADDTAEINAAITAAKAGFRGKVKLGPGWFVVSGTLDLSSCVGVTFEGEGGATIIWVNSPSANVFDLTGATQCTVRNFEIRPLTGVNRTSGDFFRLWGASRIVLEDLMIRTPWNGIDIRPLAGDLSGTPAYATQIDIHNVRFDYSDETGWGTPISIFGASAISLTNVTAVFGGKTVSSGCLMSINSDVDTVTCYNVGLGSETTDNTFALQISNTVANSTFAPRYLTFTDCYFEAGFAATNPSICILIQAGVFIAFNNLYCASALYGMAITGGEKITIIGGKMLALKQHGIAITNGIDISISGVTMRGISLANATSYDGINATATGAIDGLIVRGNIIEGPVRDAILLSGNVSNYIVTGNLTNGETINDYAQATTGIVRDNVSDVEPHTITNPADTSPSVGGGTRVLYFTQSSASDVTTFDNGYEGQIFTAVFNNGNTTLKQNSGSVVLQLSGAADFNPSQFDTVTFLRMPNSWYEVSRSVN